MIKKLSLTARFVFNNKQCFFFDKIFFLSLVNRSPVRISRCVCRISCQCKLSFTQEMWQIWEFFFKIGNIWKSSGRLLTENNRCVDERGIWCVTRKRSSGIRAVWSESYTISWCVHMNLFYKMSEARADLKLHCPHMLELFYGNERITCTQYR